ncbi:hypothetical protein K1719_041013 [Acacia pycnantha]|nr:hypothetical protein K1719_041013 [Acacia pycnantha]
MKKSSTSSLPSKPTWVLPHRTQILTDLYTLGRKLGQGQFCTTYLYTEKFTVADMPASQFLSASSSAKRTDDVWREI